MTLSTNGGPQVIRLLVSANGFTWLWQPPGASGQTRYHTRTTLVAQRLPPRKAAVWYNFQGEGGRHIDDAIVQARLVKRPDQLAPLTLVIAPTGLTPREQEILALLAQRLTNKEIAHTLLQQNATG